MSNHEFSPSALLSFHHIMVFKDLLPHLGQVSNSPRSGGFSAHPAITYSDHCCLGLDLASARVLVEYSVWWYMCLNTVFWLVHSRVPIMELPPISCLLMISLQYQKFLAEKARVISLPPEMAGDCSYGSSRGSSLSPNQRVRPSDAITEKSWAGIVFELRAMVPTRLATGSTALCWTVSNSHSSWFWKSEEL